MLARRRCTCCRRRQLDLLLEASSVLELDHRRTETACGRDAVAGFNRGGGDGCVGSIGRLLPLLDGVDRSNGRRWLSSCSNGVREDAVVTGVNRGWRRWSEVRSSDLSRQI
ncbi:hypothetical protein ACLOJK_004595 [Asimina triloba]